MHFDLKRPCNNCPFRQKGGVRLHPDRAAEIGSMMLDKRGGTFTCHKTAHALGAPRKKPEQHCAGALLFAELQGSATQPMRIAERLGIYDRDNTLNNAAGDLVWANLPAFIAAQTTTS